MRTSLERTFGELKSKVSFPSLYVHALYRWTAILMCSTLHLDEVLLAVDEVGFIGQHIGVMVAKSRVRL